MIFKKKIANTEIETVTITEFVNEFCKQFSYTHYISIDVSNNGTVHIFLGGAIDEMIVSIGSEAFADLRWKFDGVLAAVLKKMKIRDSDSASITVKVDIKLTDTETMDINTGEKLQVKNPTIDYKVTHKLEYKSESGESGTIQQADSYLTCEDGKWVIRKVDDGQMTIEDYA